MRRIPSPWRRAWLGSLALLLAVAPCCNDADNAPSSQVTSLRVLAVTADAPYAAPGDDVTFRMTFADGGSASDEPRPIQITWLSGCYNPPGDNYAACYPQVLAALQGDPELFQQEIAGPEQSGAPDAISFNLTVPDDILAGAHPSSTGTLYGTAYVFFAICAGAVRPSSAPEADAFPIECFDAGGERLGADGFVIGYTQVYVFADGRTNGNPLVQGLSLDGATLEDAVDSAPAVSPCATPSTEQGCGRQEETGCTTYEIKALMDDVAEVDPESSGSDGSPLREVIWVDYFADAGEFDGGSKLVSDAATGYREDHGTTWIPPAEPGLVTLWAVAHDARGGSSVTRRFVRVE